MIQGVNAAFFPNQFVLLRTSPTALLTDYTAHNPAPAPLQSMPLVNEPFAQVAIDIIGPLPVCKESGNRYIPVSYTHLTLPTTPYV